MQDKIEEINKDLTGIVDSEDYNGISLYCGLGGVLLFKYIFHKFYLKEAHEDLVSNLEPIISQVFEELNSSDYSFSYCDGLAGIGFCLNHLKNDNIFAEEIEEALCEFDTILVDKIKLVEFSDDLDLLHGHLGIIYYLLDRNSAVIESSVFYKNVTNFFESIRKDADDAKSSEGGFVNLGLAHGYLSYMKVLMMLMKTHKFNTPAYRTLLSDLVGIFISFKNDSPNSFSLFPSIVDADGHTHATEINLGWCYGDQPATLILYEAALVLNDEKLKQETMRMAHIWAKRNSIEKAFKNEVCDAGFCHGTISAAYQNKRWYQITGDPIFKENHAYFMKETMRLGTFEEGLSGFLKLEEEGASRDFSLLGGTAGIGIVLIDYLCDTGNNWDKFFLLDISA